jgi:adenylate cyclase
VRLGPTRIGVNAGPAVVGDFGGGRFLDYTAYGDTINVAARLEAANKALGTRICVSAGVAATATSFLGRPVGDLMLRGRVEPLRAFEPVSPKCYDAAALEGSAKAFSKLEAKDPGAMAAFAAHLGVRPDDPLASFSSSASLMAKQAPWLSSSNNRLAASLTPSGRSSMPNTRKIIPERRIN